MKKILSYLFPVVRPSNEPRKESESELDVILRRAIIEAVRLGATETIKSLRAQGVRHLTSQQCAVVTELMTTTVRAHLPQWRPVRQEREEAAAQNA